MACLEPTRAGTDAGANGLFKAPRRAALAWSGGRSNGRLSHLEIAVAGETYRLERALFREETYTDLCRIVAEAASHRRRRGYEKGLAAAA